MKPRLRRLLIVVCIFFLLFALIRIGTSAWENAVRAASAV